MQPLPVDVFLPAIVAQLQQSGAVVLQAPPGTGKTTRVPPALADALSADGQRGAVWVLEPRRIAARAAASRVAAERGERVGEGVGYAMRFDHRAGPNTRVLYVTEALLTRRLVSDPDLQGIDAVVLDEFHERSIHVDVALAWLAALRRRRPLWLVVMSATLDAGSVAKYLNCPVLDVPVPLFPVDIRHAPFKDERPLPAQVRTAVEVVHEGDTLVFLPGVGEIQRCAEALAGLDREILPLHGELGAEAQDRALRRGDRQRVVLATNVAETSVTVDGVRAVIDAGTARVPGWDPWSGLPVLQLEPISRAAATQRAGRAGRQGPGLCIRLYTRADHDGRPAMTEPEIRRMDLASTALELSGRPLPWFEAPPDAAWSAALQLLRRLGALDDQGRTPLGDAMVRLPVPPRVARMLLLASERGVAREGAALAAALGRRMRPGPAEDLVHLACAGGLGDIEAERRQLLSLLDRDHPRSRSPSEDLSWALFQAFSDRVGRRKGNHVVFSGGGSGQLEPGTPGGDGFGVVPLAERISGRVVVRAFSPIPADWLLDAADVHQEVRWAGERVEVLDQIRYGAIVVEEGPGTGDPTAVAEVLHRNVVPVAHRIFPDHEAAALLVRRVDYLRRIGLDWPAIELGALIRAGCEGARSFADLEGVSLVGLARPQLGDKAELLDRLAPTRINLPARKGAPVEYPPDQEPYVSSRLQDFFGLKEGPKVADGRPLVLHLLAPNKRPVQVTSDLSGFWTRHYPSIRRELMRRYPRHSWPEDPLRPYAEPPRP